MKPASHGSSLLASTPTAATARPARRGARPDANSSAGPQLSLSVLGDFEFCCDEEIVGLPLGVQRLVVFLALRERPLLRKYVAGALWPETTDERAARNLRSALWRL